MSVDGEAFWQFSLGFYPKPGVGMACVALQDEHGLDVNLILYCCWCGLTGRPALTVADLERGEQAIAVWRGTVIEPLRSVRRVLKGSDIVGAAEIRSGAQKLELEGERIAQELLVAGAAKPDTKASAAERQATALANLALYIGVSATVRAAAAPIEAAVAA